MAMKKPKKTQSARAHTAVRKARVKAATKSDAAAKRRPVDAQPNQQRKTRQEYEDMARQSESNVRERDDHGRFASDDDHNGNARGGRRSSESERDEQGRFSGHDDHQGRGGSRGQSGSVRERDDEGRFARDDDRGDYSRSRSSSGRERDDEGRFTSDDDRGGSRSRSRDDRDDDRRGIFLARSRWLVGRCGRPRRGRPPRMGRAAPGLRRQPALLFARWRLRRGPRQRTHGRSRRLRRRSPPLACTQRRRRQLSLVAGRKRRSRKLVRRVRRPFAGPAGTVAARGRTPATTTTDTGRPRRAIANGITRAATAAGPAIPRVMPRPRGAAGSTAIASRRG